LLLEKLKQMNNVYVPFFYRINSFWLKFVFLFPNQLFLEPRLEFFVKLRFSKPGPMTFDLIQFAVVTCQILKYPSPLLRLRYYFPYEWTVIKQPMYDPAKCLILKS
jgi:hypothetical protein